MAKQSKTIIVKKQWVPIRAPQMFSGALIGETFVVDPTQSVGKKLSVSLAAITNDHQKQSTLVGFTITGMDKNELQTTIHEIKLAPSAVKRAVRRNREKMTDSFLVKIADGATVRCKTILVTRFKTKSSILAELKKQARDVVARSAAKESFDQLANQVLSGKLQKTVFETLKKVYPVQMAEIRWLKLEGGNDKAAEKHVKDEPAAEEAKASA